VGGVRQRADARLTPEGVEFHFDANPGIDRDGGSGVVTRHMNASKHPGHVVGQENGSVAHGVIVVATA